jgi:hypothetical protein
LPQLPKDDFRIRIEPEVFSLPELDFRNFFVQVGGGGGDTWCFIDGTDVEISRQEQK